MFTFIAENNKKLVFKKIIKVLRGSANIQLHDSEFQTAAALAVKAF